MNHFITIFSLLVVSIILFFLFKDSFRVLLSEMSEMLSTHRTEKMRRKRTPEEGTITLFGEEEFEIIHQPSLIFTDDNGKDYTITLDEPTKVIGRFDLNNDRTVSREHLLLLTDLHTGSVKVKSLNEKNPLFVINEQTGQMIRYNKTVFTVNPTMKPLIRLGNSYFRVSLRLTSHNTPIFSVDSPASRLGGDTKDFVRR